MTRETDERPAEFFRSPDWRLEETARHDEVEPLETTCPHCQERFRVTEAQLQAADGQVRCGTCKTVFDGVDHLTLDRPVEFASTQDALEALDELLAELLPDDEADRAPQTAVTDQTIDLPPALPGEQDAELTPQLIPERARELEVKLAAESKRAPEAVSDAALEAHAQQGTEPGAGADAEVQIASQPGPDAGAGLLAESRVELEPERRLGPARLPPARQVAAPPVVFGDRRSRSRLWIWLVVLPLGICAIAAQILWMRFDTLVRDPDWRPLYASICQRIGCKLPVQRSLEQIQTRNLVVGTEGVGSGSVRVQAVIVNEAPFAQPFPTIELRFTALNGTLVAGHRFLPAEYLAGEARRLSSMPMGTPVQFELSVPDPGALAVSYEIRFR